MNNTTASNDYLFVYGILMQNIDSQIAHFLRVNSLFIGEGKMKGYLYDLGAYPAAVYQRDAEQVVFGHIFELYDIDKTLTVLDEYEGTEYNRAKVDIESNGAVYSCWVYLYQRTVAGLSLIESGSYLDYLSNPNSEH